MESTRLRTAGTAGSAGARAAAALRELGLLLALEPGNQYRARAYERAASVVEAVADLEGLDARGELTSLPGVGSAIAATLQELVRTGRSKLLERWRKKFPPGAAELSRVLSLARIRLVHEALGISTLEGLRAACEAGRIRALPGFGPKTERKLLDRLDAKPSRRAEVILPKAASQGEALREQLRGQSGVTAVELAGDLRRRSETIDRLELVVACARPAAFAEQVRRLPGVFAVEQTEPGRLRVRRLGGLDAFVRAVPPAEFAVAWVDATGSAGHVAELAQLAKKRGLTLDERSLRRGRRALRVESEAALYERLGLQLVPPELREDAGEIEAAARGALPDDLVRVEHIQGAVHCHTEYSDGRDTVEEMARAAEARGLRYLTITDHSASATYAGGLDVERLERQADEIAEVRERVGIRILHGTESDILRDGELDYPARVLERLDVVIASVHQRYKLDADAMTERLVREMRNPLFKIWGHALGRYVLSRPPFACHMDVVLDAIADSRAAIEVNGDPHRLDLAPNWIRQARERGIPFVVSTDAHSTGQLANVRWGVDMARRGWLRRRDVLNTLGPDEFAAAVKP
jgi:DNA polymerase (family 10)